MARGLIAALALCAAANALLYRTRPARQDPLGMRLEADSAVETASLFGLGMRRLAADLGLIRLLQYYGSPEPEALHREDFDPEHPELSFGGGSYPELGSMA